MKILNIAICCILALSMASCDDFLDVRPKAEKLERELFKDAKGFESAIYGVYGTLQKESLYGKDMLWGITEVLAQNLQSGNEMISKLAKYDYESDTDMKSMFAGVWGSAYQTIGYANNILNQLENWSPASLPLYNYYKGEMLGVRALLHFDLLRLFAPIDESKQGIPYVKTYDPVVKPFSTVGEVYSQIIADLIEAEGLLKEQESLIVYPRNDANYHRFLNYQETHFNLYVVRALLARVYWMKSQGKAGEDLKKAGEYAESVIKSGKFPLVDRTEIKDYLAGTISPKETIFGIYSTSYQKTAETYLYNFNTYASFNPYKESSYDSYTKVYKKNVPAQSQDYRLDGHFTSSNEIVKCLKLVDVYAIENKVPVHRQNLITGVTLMHTSEMYLIAAEALLNTNKDLALKYFDDEISSRGLSKLSQQDVTLTSEIIYNEYHKELYGEGQVWFNLKRLNRTIKSNAESRDIPGNDKIYVLPIPEEEFEYRN